MDNKDNMNEKRQFDQYIAGLATREAVSERANFFYKAFAYKGEAFDITIYILNADYIDIVDESSEYPEDSIYSKITIDGAVSFDDFLFAFTKNLENAAIVFYVDDEKKKPVVIRRLPDLDEYYLDYGIDDDDAIAGIKLSSELNPEEDYRLCQFIEYLFNPYTDLRV